MKNIVAQPLHELLRPSELCREMKHTQSNERVHIFVPHASFVVPFEAADSVGEPIGSVLIVLIIGVSDIWTADPFSADVDEAGVF